MKTSKYDGLIYMRQIIACQKNGHDFKLVEYNGTVAKKCKTCGIVRGLD